MASATFLTKIETALSSFDVDKVCACYDVPCTLIHEDLTVLVDSEAVLRARAIKSLRAMHDAGIRSFKFTLVASTAVGASLTMVRYQAVRTLASGAQHDPAHEAFVLRDYDGELRIVVSINPRSSWTGPAA